MLFAAIAAVTVIGTVLIAKRRLGRRRRLVRLRQALEHAIRDLARHRSWDRSAACILLSGGLDSAIVAEVAGGQLGLKTALTVICSDDATDLPYATASAAAAGLEHVVVRIPLDELLRRYLPSVVRTLQSFDPMTLRNDVAISCALHEAAARGFRCAATGDGADELLGGYGFTHRLEPAAWAAHRAHMARVMKFGSAPLGAALGLFVASPYTAPGMKAVALRLAKSDCVESLDGLTTGKMPLRRLFPQVTASGRRKDPIEVGCGTTALSQPGYFDHLVSDEQFASEKAYVAAHHGVEIRDKEHLYYYRVFRETFPNGIVPNKPRHGSDPCPKCGYQLSDRFQTFCVTCGHYDPNMRSRHSA
ncbi:hypothetical protein PLESTF_001819300 [Pleodorina starrii]|nr:hypothetical protein PLESTF_001819300 [Pleodorina starrii]